MKEFQNKYLFIMSLLVYYVSTVRRRRKLVSGVSKEPRIPPQILVSWNNLLNDEPDWKKLIWSQLKASLSYPTVTKESKETV